METLCLSGILSYGYIAFKSIRKKTILSGICMYVLPSVKYLNIVNVFIEKINHFYFYILKSKIGMGTYVGELTSDSKNKDRDISDPV